MPDSKKKLVLVDPGFRIHLTSYSWSTAQSPSGFVAKLRKHVKTRRLTRIKLAPENRVLMLSFSDDYSYHLVFEFFAGGNMILLDKECKILALQRIVSATDTHERCAVNEIYPLEEYLNDLKQQSTVFTPEIVQSWLEAERAKKDDNEAEQDDTEADRRDESNPLQGESKAKPKKQTGGERKSKVTLKKLLYMNVPGIATGLIETCLLAHDLNADMNSADIDYRDTGVMRSIFDSIADAQRKSQELITGEQTVGYILAKRNLQFKPSGESVAEIPVIKHDISSIDPNNIEYLYEEFQPYQPRTPNTKDLFKIFETVSYNQAVDLYFSTIEATKVSLKTSNQEAIAEKKLQAARTEKDKRVRGLNDVQEKSNILGTALQENATRIEEAAQAVRDLMNQGMDWLDIEKLIKVEQSRDNPVAEIISIPLNLIKNKMSLILPIPGQKTEDEDDSATESESDSDDDKKNLKQQKKTVKVEIDLGMSAWANARTYFDVKKSAAAKQERTLQTADQAYKSAEKKIKRDLKQALEKERSQQQMLHSIRAPFWFEKFYWFLSSDAYLVIAGRDSQQNELIFRRHFKQHDILVHSDIDGTAVVVIKNHLHVPEVPPATLSQAGAFALATSKAWDSKMTPSAWWARYGQVPKLRPDGSIVSSTMMTIEGEGKHWLPPGPIDMGFGFLWLVDDESKYPNLVKISALAEEQSKESGEENSNDNVEENGARDAVGETIRIEQHTADEEGSLSDHSDDSSDEEFPDTQVNDEIIEPNANNDQQEEDLESELESHYNNTKSDAGASARTISSEGIKRLTAKERRLTRKQRNNNDEVSAEGEEPTSVSNIEKALNELKIKERPAVSEQNAPKVRGRKGKMKKIAKYADQDEEDRQARMELLGTTKGLERARAEQEAAKAKRDQQEQAKRDRQKRLQQAEIKRLMQEQDGEGSEEENENRADEQYYFSKIVPRLVSGDTPLSAIPVFGPWGSMQRYKFKVKLQQGGSVKKGKAIRDIARAIITNSKVDPESKDTDMPWPKEIDCIKAIKENELSLPVAVSKVKFSIPGQNSNVNKTSNGQKKKGSKR